MQCQSINCDHRSVALNASARPTTVKMQKCWQLRVLSVSWQQRAPLPRTAPRQDNRKRCKAILTTARLLAATMHCRSRLCIILPSCTHVFLRERIPTGAANSKTSKQTSKRQNPFPSGVREGQRTGGGEDRNCPSSASYPNASATSHFLHALWNTPSISNAHHSGTRAKRGDF